MARKPMKKMKPKGPAKGPKGPSKTGPKVKGVPMRIISP